MAITNTSIKNLGDYTVSEIGSFSIEQLAGVSFDRQFTPVTNTSKISFGETWNSVTTTWASEPRTWLDCSSLIDNTSHKNLGSYSISEVSNFSVEQLANISFERQFSPVINTSKPI